jgi:tryptophan-rich sensory protein
MVLVFCNDAAVLFIMIFAVVWLFSLLPVAMIDGGCQRRIYAAMSKRVAFAPPSYVFSVVWSVLNVLASIAMYIVLDDNLRCFDDTNSAAVANFFVLQFVQMFYIPVMFTAQWKIVATLVVFVCLVLAGVTTWLFWEISTGAGVLMLFVVVWLLFALVLSISIVLFPSRADLARAMNSFTGQGGDKR